ncbi:hypothetical protein GJ744_011532 [Endocarpon pusillum]|uniref:Uncharacterized protein n=1 Tax=Endocarpon pusillum TaxID=364733 RepID=A0A8H7ACQ7_9EURO|nr:hypothetical protein GJ744_011532 [Endocarpon pusillum]
MPPRLVIWDSGAKGPKFQIWTNQKITAFYDGLEDRRRTDILSSLALPSPPPPCPSRQIENICKAAEMATYNVRNHVDQRACSGSEASLRDTDALKFEAEDIHHGNVEGEAGAVKGPQVERLRYDQWRKHRITIAAALPAGVDTARKLALNQRRLRTAGGWARRAIVNHLRGPGVVPGPGST